MQNDYSNTWFDLFLQSFPAAQTEKEIAFLVRHLPQPNYTTVVDFCCGTSRHTRLLAARSYQMVGVDRSRIALAEAQRLSGPNITFYEADMRNFIPLPGSFDAVLNLWQSFGYFDNATNSDLIHQISQKLNSCGRFVLDIYHRGFFEHQQGERPFVKDGVSVIERKTMQDNRLTVQLIYGNAAKEDVFDWQLYTPDEVRELAASIGFHCCVACTDFDEHAAPTPTKPRMQFVFEKQT